MNFVTNAKICSQDKTWAEFSTLALAAFLQYTCAVMKQNCLI